jgi:hypothetical protein
MEKALRHRTNPLTYHSSFNLLLMNVSVQGQESGEKASRIHSPAKIVRLAIESILK